MSHGPHDVRAVRERTAASVAGGLPPCRKRSLRALEQWGLLAAGLGIESPEESDTGVVVDVSAQHMGIDIGTVDARAYEHGTCVSVGQP